MKNKENFVQIWNTFYNKNYLESLYGDLEFAQVRLNTNNNVKSLLERKKSKEKELDISNENESLITNIKNKILQLLHIN